MVKMITLLRVGDLCRHGYNNKHAVKNRKYGFGAPAQMPDAPNAPLSLDKSFCSGEKLAHSFLYGPTQNTICSRPQNFILGLSHFTSVQCFTLSSFRSTVTISNGK